MIDSTVYEQLLGAAIGFVSFRPRSEREIRDFLNKKIIKRKLDAHAVLETVITRLSELSYVNDCAFAKWWIEQRNTFRPKGKRALIFELQQKGISKPNIDQAFESLSESQPDEMEVARNSIQKKLGLWARLPPLEQKKKLYSFLSLRGFSGEIISKIIDEVCKKEYNEG